MKKLTVNLQTLMAKKKIRTVMEVAVATEISSKTLYKIINNQTKRIDFETIIKLCKFFNCGVDDLLVFEDRKVG